MTLEDEDEEKMDFDSYLWEVVEKTVEVEPRSTPRFSFFCRKKKE